MNRIFYRLIPLALFLFTAPAFADDQKTKLGFLLPLSGHFAEAGEQCRLGIETAILINDSTQKVQAVYGDNQFKAQASLIEFRKLVEVDQVSAALSFGSTVSLPLAEPANQAKLPMIVLAGHPQIIELNKFAWRAFPGVVQTATQLKEIISSNETVAIITTEDEWLLSLARELQKQLKEQGTHVIEDQKIDTEQTEFRALLNRLMTADAIYANIFTGQLVTLIKQLRAANYRGKIFSNYYIQQTDVTSALGAKNLEGIIFPEGNLERPKFNEFYKKVSSKLSPTITTYGCYAGTTLLLHGALAAANASNVAEKRAAIFANLSAADFVSVSDEKLPILDREITLPVKLFQFKAGKPVALELH